MRLSVILQIKRRIVFSKQLCLQVCILKGYRSATGMGGGKESVLNTEVVNSLGMKRDTGIFKVYLKYHGYLTYH